LRRLHDSALLEKLAGLGGKHELLAALATHENLGFRTSNHSDVIFLPAGRAERFIASAGALNTSDTSEPA
jgi:hypothetical protein